MDMKTEAPVEAVSAPWRLPGTPSSEHRSFSPSSSQTSPSSLLRIQSISFAGCFKKSIYLGGVYVYVSFFSFSFLL